MSEESKETEEKEKPLLMKVLDLVGSAELPLTEAIGILELAKTYMQIGMVNQLLKVKNAPSKEKVVDFKVE
jgi:hypothetical protein